MLGEVLGRPGRRSAPAGRRPHIIMMFAPKGGVGKTTLSTNLAVAAAKAGHRVAGLDFDGQRAFAAWGADRSARKAADSLAEVTVRGAHLNDWRDELHLVRQYGVVVVDSPPGVEPRNQRALQEVGAEADLIVMPTEVYGGSIRYVVDFMGWWGAKPGRALFVINKTIAGRSMLREAREFLMTRGEVWEESIPLRDDVARAYEAGLSVLDDERMGGSDAFAALWRACAKKVGMAP